MPTVPRVLCATLGVNLRGGGGTSSCSVRTGTQEAVVMQQVPEADNELQININLPESQSKAQQTLSAP